MMYDAVMDYALAGKAPDALPALLNGFFLLLKPNIDSSLMKYSAAVENGKKGGRPKGKPSKNPAETQMEPSENQDKEKEMDRELKADKPPRAKRFTPPTLAEVQAYVAERHSPVDPQGFIDFYASKGWMVGKTPMKDWKAACRNAEKWERWEHNAKQSNPEQPLRKLDPTTGAWR